MPWCFLYYIAWHGRKRSDGPRPNLKRVIYNHSHLIWSRLLACFFTTSILNSVLRPLRRSVHPILYLLNSKMSTESSIIIPDGFSLHTENNSHILRSSNEAFLNPVQEFNRDTSVACIRVWSEEMNKTKEAKWRWAQEKKVKKLKDGATKKRKGSWYHI